MEAAACSSEVRTARSGKGVHMRSCTGDARRIGDRRRHLTSKLNPQSSSAAGGDSRAGDAVAGADGRSWITFFSVGLSSGERGRRRTRVGGGAVPTAAESGGRETCTCLSGTTEGEGLVGNDGQF